ncbi:MAG: hemerythrin domain-containing protein [Flavobacteriales bacterium]|nr:hemerythrin domain-containing protein [Flavobacteriales bacterium]
MNKPLHDYFTQDHRRLEKILDQACTNPDAIDAHLYHDFRVGLLTHIKMEEKILFVAAREANDGVPIPLAAKLRLDHGALTALMVVPPNAAVIAAVRHILDEHDRLEEEPGGMYDICEKLTHAQTAEVLQRLEQTTPVPVHPPNTHPIAVDSANRAMARAGFDLHLEGGTSQGMHKGV